MLSCASNFSYCLSLYSLVKNVHDSLFWISQRAQAVIVKWHTTEQMAQQLRK